MSNPIKTLSKFGQSIWLDYIIRDILVNGDLKKMIDEDGLRGMTSNPAIFEQAFANSKGYVDDIKKMAKDGHSLHEIYETLTQRDVRDAADVFRATYDATDRLDGYVSLEVNPHLAHETEKTLKEARELWNALDRPNVLIKVPATKEGLPVIQQLITDGINVNVTLLFGLERYREVAEAYIKGLEARVAAGKSIDHIASVASFFLSRIDTLVDPMLEKVIAEGGPGADLAKQMHGKTAIASAKGAYRIFLEMFNSNRFQKLRDKGAKVQRLLWASTSTKNPDYSDVLYVDALIGPQTVNTIPVETFKAYLDHGDPAERLENDPDDLVGKLTQLADAGVDLDKCTQQLEDEGVAKFNKAFDKLTDTLKKTMS